MRGVGKEIRGKAYGEPEIFLERKIKEGLIAWKRVVCEAVDAAEALWLFLQSSIVSLMIFFLYFFNSPLPSAVDTVDIYVYIAQDSFPRLTDRQRVA